MWNESSGSTVPDEAMSLAGALVGAGATGCVGTLWSVDAEATRLLLTRFYQLWLETGLHPAEALREAQVWLRDLDRGDRDAIAV